MAREQQEVVIQAQILCARIAMEGMKAENAQRIHRGEAMAYVEADFVALIAEFGIGHDAVMEVMGS